MTNKLPVVGRRYKNKQNKHNHLEYKITQIIYFDKAIGFVFENGENFVMQKKIFTKGFADSIDTLYEDFFKCFEELPEDKTESRLPEVGKRYKTKGRGLWWHKESEVCGVYNGKVWIDMCYSDNNNKIMSLEQFYGSHEELPEDKAETKPETRSHVSELSPEVKEAMEKLNWQIENDSWGSDRQNTHERLLFFSKNLLNALDKQFNCNGYFEGLPPSKEAIERSKEKEVVDNKIKGEGQIVTPLEEEVEEESMEATVKESLTVWKPVSELEYYEDEPVQTVLVKYQNGRINLRGNNAAFVGDEKFCRIGDFINDYENLKERVKKLEGK